MGTQNPSASPHAEARTTGDKPPNQDHRTGGLIHRNTRHTARFTVIGNHLAQHRELSLLAIGLGVHLQSLPAGARVDIKSLTARFPEGATRIAAALRELEAHGCLRRRRERVPDGRIVTRTISCNQPAAAHHEPHPPRERRGTHPQREKGESREGRTPPRPLPAVPRPAHPAPALLQAAAELLADLPPEGLRRPAALLAHRLTAQLPPPPPFRAPPPVRHPFQTCDHYDRAFRAPHPGHCRDCRTEDLEAA
ncbi:helix-turn-helix domain-containing protein [Streptomyces similanensis]|uniref:Helix-turn-helix domain-containing protein n=1 Tax=Streptomyces similanensis TaxID=1274988 RepID=A0ABP9KSA4_9ACTN